MNYSNPTNTIQLNGLPSTRISYRNSSNNHDKLNTQFEQVLLKENLIADSNENEHEEKCLTINEKSCENINLHNENA